MAREVGLTLLDIGNPSEKVSIGDQEVSVTGIAAEGCLALFIRFPELQQYLGGGGVSVSDLIKTAPDVIAAVIAAGTGTLGDDEAESIARKLPVEVQLDILEAIVRLTFRSGFGPFVQRIATLSAAIGTEVKYVKGGKETPTTSQPELKPSLPPDTDPSTSGSTPLAK